MIRKFYLENERGVKFYFKYTTGVLFSDVAGLGFDFNLGYLKYEHIHQTISQDTELSEITGVLNFIEGYASYQRFIEYINQGSQNLKLYYTSQDTKYALVDIARLSKGEIAGGILKSEVVFQKKSYWIKERQIIIDVSDTEGGKLYPYGYGYSYRMTQQGKTTILIGGSIPASVLIEINGNVSDPELNVIQNDEVTSSLRININEHDAKIVVSSIPDQRFMNLIKDSITHDIYAYQDFQRDNFIKLNPGQVTLEFNPGVMTPTICKVHIYEYHLG